ncbi:glycosyltransferase family 2 protein [Clostridium tyrobutyricum]|uniref:glycosyltransferase family 2 protein n=1 Tax=Clostridium tyrobutyricum TaxID=1519 RepID=UPI00057FB220|nr:glycosyltransferase family 2 protein [Clostridium tyrobutyricum]
MKQRDSISIVVPCYNEEEAIPIFYGEVVKILNTIPNIDYEIIYINDGSRDKSAEEMKQLGIQDDHVKYILFSRNFGKEAAMYAGLKESKGDYIAIMDVDLQDPPALLKEMYEALKSEYYDSVATRRVTRKGEPPIRSLFARLYYKLINKLSKTQIVDGARDFRLMKRQMVDAVLSITEYNRFTKGIFSWVGFETKWLEYENIERVAGETKWSFWKLFLYSIESIVAFSTAPLALASVLGIILFGIAIVFIVLIIVRTLYFGDSTSGWPSLVCIILLVSGIQLLCIGIIGEYLAKTYLETKRRPLYIIKEKNTDQEKNSESENS